MNVVVATTDEREIEVLASGFPFHHGAQVAEERFHFGVGVLVHKLTESTALWRHAPDETKNTSTRNCSGATDAPWLSSG